MLASSKGDGQGARAGEGRRRLVAEGLGMPCHDVHESIRLSLDADGRLIDYELRKLSCGAEVGHPSLLAARLAGSAAESILALDGESIFEGLVLDSSFDDPFLVHKHLVALQEALAVWTGARTGGPEDACATARVSYDGSQTEFEGLLRVELLSERIEACGGCRRCVAQQESPTSRR